jgi:GYF domain 2/TM2 domain
VSAGNEVGIEPLKAEWYYIGHYGQLGPLTREQIDELIEGGVISRETYVWREGMSDWVVAQFCSELTPSFASSTVNQTPPPSPTGRPIAPPSYAPSPTYTNPQSYSGPPQTTPFPRGYSGLSTLKSDKNRVLGGILQLIVPGLGRIYLGYSAIGVLQLVLSACGVGVIWAWIDAIIILTGGVNLDGYGRQLND